VRERRPRRAQLAHRARIHRIEPRGEVRRQQRRDDTAQQHPHGTRAARHGHVRLERREPRPRQIAQTGHVVRMQVRHEHPRDVAGLDAMCRQLRQQALVRRQLRRRHPAIEPFGERLRHVVETIGVTGVVEDRPLRGMDDECRQRREVDRAKTAAADRDPFGMPAPAHLQQMQATRVTAS
jgi:hypothetical protein